MAYPCDDDPEQQALASYLMAQGRQGQTSMTGRQAATTAGSMVPGMGLLDALGMYPAGDQGFSPSMRQNIGQGEYLDAMFQLLGAGGDLAMATGIGVPVGMTMKAAAKAGKAAKATGINLVEGGLSGRKIPIRPSSDDAYEVMDANFEYGKVGSNTNMPIKNMSGGVRMNDKKEAQRVSDLARKISSPDGYVSRILVDDLGNVLEGQHRLEALRYLGEKNAPVTVIQDLSNKYNIVEMKKAISGQMRSDQSNQLVKAAIDALEDSGSVEQALADYVMPSNFQKVFEDAIKASTFAPTGKK